VNLAATALNREQVQYVVSLRRRLFFEVFDLVDVDSQQSIPLVAASFKLVSHPRPVGGPCTQEKCRHRCPLQPVLDHPFDGFVPLLLALLPQRVVIEASCLTVVFCEPAVANDVHPCDVRLIVKGKIHSTAHPSKASFSVRSRCPPRS